VDLQKGSRLCDVFRIRASLHHSFLFWKTDIGYCGMADSGNWWNQILL